MNTQKLIRSGVANDTGKLRPSLQHGLEAALSVSDSMIDEVLAHLSLVTDPGRLTNLPQELAAIDPDQVEQLVLHSDALKATWDRELRRQVLQGTWMLAEADGISSSTSGTTTRKGRPRQARSWRRRGEPEARMRGTAEPRT